MSGDVDFPTWQALTGVLVEEAACLDEQRWDDWLALFTEDAVLWAPAWDAEHRLTTDPQSEVSLFYVEGRPALSDRVWRWSRGDSPASVPLAVPEEATSTFSSGNEALSGDSAGSASTQLRSVPRPS